MRKIAKQISSGLHFYLCYFYQRNGCRDFYKFIHCIFFQQLPYRMIFWSWAALLIDGGIIIVGSYCSPIVTHFLLESICPCAQSEVCPSMHHVHCERVLVCQQKLVVSQDFLSALASPFLSPMSHPPRIYLSPKHEPFLLELPHCLLLAGVGKIIDSNIGAFPMAFFYIFNPVNIILSQVNIQIFPYLSQLLHVGFVIAVESVLVLNLEHNDTPIVVRRCAHVVPYDGSKCFKIYLSFTQEHFVVCPQFDIGSIQEACRHPSEVPLSTDVGSRPKQYHHGVFLSELQEEGEIFVTGLEVEDTLGDLMKIPNDVNTQRIESKSLNHQYPMLPILYRYPRIVHLSRSNGQQSTCINA